MKFDVVKSESKVLHVVPFNSEKKRGGVAIKRVTIMILSFECHVLPHCICSIEVERQVCAPNDLESTEILFLSKLLIVFTF